MGNGQRERCLVNGCERAEEEELKSQEVSIRVSRLAEEPGEFWSSAAASLKPSVRVMIPVGGLGQAQDDAGGGFACFVLESMSVSLFGCNHIWVAWLAMRQAESELRLQVAWI